MPPIRAILFDKDGTLFDFQATWGAWARTLLQELSAGDDARAARMAAVMAFDTGTARFRPESPVIAGTGREVADLLAPLCGQPVDQLERRLSAAAAAAPLSRPRRCAPCLRRSGRRGCAWAWRPTISNPWRGSIWPAFWTCSISLPDSIPAMVASLSRACCWRSRGIAT